MNEKKISLNNNSDSNLTRVGLRLKKVRLMAGFTRQALENKYGISVNTLQAWENAKSPLTLKGANRVIKALQDSGVECSMDWLFHGSGSLPRLKDEEHVRDIISLCGEKDNPNSNQINWNDESAILREIESFRAFNPNGLVIIVTDDGMSPLYSIGDYVGGKRKVGESLDKFIGINCIIETKEGATLLRRLERGKSFSLYTLSCINPGTVVHFPTLYDIEIMSVAPIIWHRKKDILSST